LVLWGKEAGRCEKGLTGSGKNSSFKGEKNENKKVLRYLRGGSGASMKERKFVIFVSGRFVG